VGRRARTAAARPLQEGQHARFLARIHSWGFGTLYIDPKRLPAGPFLAYNHDGKLVGSIYTVPVTFNDLAANHRLRIPERATPWDSRFLVNPGDRFEVTFAEEGVYDYFGLPHEGAGMVGRLIVGHPGGPGHSRVTFPSIASVMAGKIVRLEQFSQGGASRGTR
jgi:hypothetical protein